MPLQVERGDDYDIDDEEVDPAHTWEAVRFFSHRCFGSLSTVRGIVCAYN